MMRRPVVFGIKGTELLPEERAFFSMSRPVGFILFKRNCENPEQLKKLTKDLRASLKGAPCAILIDQEGGPVVRLGPPHWPKFEGAARFGALWEEDPLYALNEVRETSRLMADELAALGITVNCAPVIDLWDPETDSEVIGQRCFSEDPAVVVALARAFMEEHRHGGVKCVMKHLPGYGRAPHDTHKQPAVIDAPTEVLDATDFVPIRQLKDAPMAMVGHAIYTFLDADVPASQSETVVTFIRQCLGFRGLLLSDDIVMNGLSGTLVQRTERAFQAGIDVVLHCSGEIDEMIDVSAACPMLPSRLFSKLF